MARDCRIPTDAEALCSAGKQHAHNNPDEGIGKCGKHLDKLRIFLQNADRSAHGTHAEHKYSKAQHNITDMDILRLLGDHAEQNPHDGNNPCQS